MLATQINNWEDKRNTLLLLLVANNMSGLKTVLFLSILALSFSESNLSSLGGVDMCPPCVQFGKDELLTLYNYVNNHAIPNSCDDICGILKAKLPVEICGFLCLSVGVKVFTEDIKKDAPDPIYFCEDLKQCPAVKGGAANITNTYVTPSTAAQFSTFNIQVLFQVTKETGTGEVALTLKTPDKSVLTQSYLNEGFPIGAYSAKFQVVTDGGYPAGNYTGQVAVCTGTCGSASPISVTLATTNVKFTVTQQA
ncbi:unnamed protein product [Blepharisma stoltei]|uniref:Uncharacterized protein n=1 Tax=Blepharisma stoltei TaxID=1481888 RepID=A0AAU9IQ99_9CILI|nr:unnamed protein product [Blepharisma stoltei]